jgi:hypothetical protein
MRIQRVLISGSGAESWTVLGEDCPMVSRDHVTGYRSRLAWSAVGRIRGSWSARSAARSSPRLASLFGTIPDPAEHPLAHHEGDHRHRLDQQRRPPLGVRIALAHQ